MEYLALLLFVPEAFFSEGGKGALEPSLKVEGGARVSAMEEG